MPIERIFLLIPTLSFTEKDAVHWLRKWEKLGNQFVHSELIYTFLILSIFLAVYRNEKAFVVIQALLSVNNSFEREPYTSK